MKNTFWTLIENNYYRIHNGILKYAPADFDNNIISEEESHIEVISIEQLELINDEFNSNFLISDFK